MTISIELIKRKILDKAMRGELVEQNPNDEPAEILLKRIEEKKTELIKEKKIRKHNLLSPIDEEKLPYELPNGWKWTLLNNIALIRRGASPRPIKKYVTESENGVPWIKIGDAIESNKYITSTNEKITLEGASKSVFLRSGSLIMSNSMSFGKAYILGIDGCIHDGWLSFEVPNKHINNEWLLYFLNGSFEQFKSKAVGTSVKNLNIDRVRATLIPVPPFNEQKRIVDKIESLFRLCDSLKKEIEKQQKYLSALREKVLDDAMKGLLVEQEKNDEPAKVLVKKIEEEKQKLIEKKLIKKQKPLPPINKDEIPYNLPQGWKWERLGNLIELISGRDLTKADYNDEGKGIPYIMGASNIQDGALKIERWTENPTVIGKKGDLLISVKGTIGKMAIQQIEEAHLSRQIMGIRIISEVEPLYIYAFLKTHISYLQSNAKSFIPGISRNDILMSKIPLAPIQEQKRIIKKIERIIDHIKEFKSHMVLPD